ncbi:MAG: YicC family protein [Chlamydiia bacterium]|nr:YicC family protein [Chlamydiia bacterium]
MLASMTGFGRASLDSPLGKVTVEIQSLNRKYLEIFVSLPKEFGQLEYEMRNWISAQIDRGQISLRLFLQFSPEAAVKRVPDAQTLSAVKRRLEALAQEIGYDVKEIDFPLILHYLPVEEKLQFADKEEALIVERCVQEALQQLVRMKHKEGVALSADVTERLALLEKQLMAIEEISPEASERMRERVREKISAWVQLSPEWEEKAMKEVVILAERMDVTEEITRLKSHFKQFRDIVNSSKGAVGRKMDFLIQEMGREINTLGSKASDAKISYFVVEMKSELEKMREQTQNIE